MGKDWFDYGTTRVKSPCYRCPDRSPTCHRAGECDKWAAYLEERERERAKIVDNKRTYKKSAYNPRKN